MIYYKSKVRHLIKTGKTFDRKVARAWNTYVFAKNGFSIKIDDLDLDIYSILLIIFDEVAKEEERLNKKNRLRRR